MIKLCYSRQSKPSALAIAEASDGEIVAVRNSEGDVNWGRANADTLLNTDTSNTTNKREMFALFIENEVPVPKYYSASHAAALDWQHQDTWLVGRPDQHTRGRGFWLCKNADDVEKALRGTRRKAAATHFMEYIDAPHELRVHIFNGKSIRISEKKVSGSDGNHKLYTTIKPTVDVKLARRAAKKAVKALELDFGCVDVLVEEDGTPYVLEVNTAPGLGGSMPKLYADAIKKWMEEYSGE